MIVRPTELEGVLVIEPRCFDDDRGWFTEAWNRRAFRDAGMDCDFVQDNQSMSRRKGTVRGLHFQAPPAAQAKLVRVVQGAALDVAVDLRRDSPTFRRVISEILSAENGRQLFIPEGFAHGFCTLEDDTVVLYKVSRYYAPETERGIVWNDPQLAIPWPLDGLEPVVSEKDRLLPPLAQQELPF